MPADKKTALLLSAGGMFGAYQAGAWEVLAKHVKPDIVIGTSVGALNGWAIAGGCDARELQRLWLEESIALPWRLPWNPAAGIVDCRRFDPWVAQLHREYSPKVAFGAVLTQLPQMRQRLFRNDEVTWQHLAGSCSVPLVFQPRRISGRVYADGGLVNSLPLWAAAEMGATRIVAIHALQHVPGAWLRTWRVLVRPVARRNPQAPALPTFVLAPARPLGTMREMLQWRRQNISDWIDQGKQDAQYGLAALQGVLSQ